MLYLSALFKKRYLDIHQQISKHTEIKEIPNTNDIWIRDFMPIQNTDKEYIVFKYFPKYLKNPKHHSLLSDNQSICQKLNITYSYCDIILDGRSIIYDGNLYVVSERILVDNPLLNKNQIVSTLEEFFKTDKIILLPESPNDFTGHLDGALAILDDKTILMNDYKEEFGSRMSQILQNNGFDLEHLPYNPYHNKTYQSAKGIYINYIDSSDQLFIPTFNIPEDELALTKFSSLFPHKNIIPILCNELAKEGGLLHCVSWED